MVGLLVKLLDVALLDAAHEVLAAEKVIVKLAGELARYDENLIPGDFVPCNGTPRGNQVRAPLKHEAEIPKNKEGEDEGSCGSNSGGTKPVGTALQKNGEPDDEKNGERNEEAIAIGRDAGPVGIRSHEIVKSERGAKDRAADAGSSATKKKDADGGEEQEWSPGKEAVVGGEKKLEQEGRGPMPLRDRDITGFN